MGFMYERNAALTVLPSNAALNQIKISRSLSVYATLPVFVPMHPIQNVQTM